MKGLKRVGFFRELIHGDRDGPSLKESLGDRAATQNPQIVRYLLDAPLMAAFPGLVDDVIKPTITIGPAHIRGDGVWMWPQDLAYYVERYEARLPDEFIAHITASGFRPPKESEIRFMTAAREEKNGPPPG